MIKHLYAACGNFILNSEMIARGDKPEIMIYGLGSRVADEAEAVRETLAAGMEVLSTHEVYTDLQRNDKGQDIRLSSGECNHALSYVGFDRVYARDELIEKLRETRLAPQFNAHQKARANDLRYLEKADPSRMFLYREEKGPIPLSPENRVFDREGRPVRMAEDPKASAPRPPGVAR